MCPPSSFATTDTAKLSHDDMTDIIPQTKLSQSAYEHADSIIAPEILNHSIRVYLYARALAAHTNSAYSTDSAKQDLLFTACLFHDIGTTTLYDGPQRFEVEGADAATQHLTLFGVSEADKHDVWVAIACHTCLGIAERIGELARLVRAGVSMDFKMETAGKERLEELRDELEVRFQRAGFEKVLSDAVVGQAVKQPKKAPSATWPGMLYRAHLAEPGW